MRPTFLAFETAYRALATSQTNIDITGNNLANVNTFGYTRQRVDQNSIANTALGQRFVVFGSKVGFGVEVSGISQIRDPFLDARYRTESAENGKYNSILEGLKDLERVLDEVDTHGIQSEMSEFVKQLQTLSTEPTSKDLSLIVRTAAQKLTQLMNTYSNLINEVRNQQIYDLQNVVVDNEFNTLVANIANLNTQIREELVHGNVPNELYDKRNVLIDQLSGIANIRVTVTPERISEDLTIENLSISLYDAASGGKTIGLVDGGMFNTLSVREDALTGQYRIDIATSFGAPPDNDITDYITGGSIRGYLDLINGKGIYANTAAGENDFRGTLYFLESMNTFARTFAETFNDINAKDPASGGSKPLFSAADGSGVITAGNITVSQDWMDDPLYITTTIQNPALGEPDNILRMIEAISSRRNFLNGTTPVFNGSFAEYLTGMTGELALDISQYTNYAETSDSVLLNLFYSREAISGVNMDEEGINLMAFQKSYNAAARYFTVLDEGVDTIINKMGIVGR